MMRLGVTSIAFVVLWLVLDRTAAVLGSLRGEQGAIVCAIVLPAAVLVESTLSRRPPQDAAKALGLTTPKIHALRQIGVLAGALAVTFVLLSSWWGVSRPRDGAALLALGILLQGGIAEEVVFRGFLFRRLLEGRGFWQAAWLAAIPFTVVHLTLLATMDPTVALASTLLSLLVSFPLSRAFVVGEGVWGAALLHAIIQGAPKVVAEDHLPLPVLLGWMAASASLPWLVFLIKPRRGSA